MKNDLTKQPLHSNSASAQRQRIFSYLQEHKRMTTLCARDQLDIPSPAPRIYELRHDYNINIKTHWRTDETHKGKKHRVAEYVLFSGKFKHDMKACHEV